MKAVREADPAEIKNYYDRLRTICSFPEQLVFLDEKLKDGRDTFWYYARSKHDNKAVAKVLFSHGNRVSMLAALD